MVNRKEERNTVEVSTMVRPVNFLERNAYRQLTMTRSEYPMKLVVFFQFETREAGSLDTTALERFVLV